MSWTLKPRASRNLKRHGNAQITHQWVLMVMALAFWIMAVRQDTPVMGPELYGLWVTSFPAELWAGSIMFASMFYLAGCYINGEWRWSPLLRLIGALWHIFTMGAFAWGAWSVGSSAMVMISASFVALHIWFAALNASDLLGAIFKWDRG